MLKRKESYKNHNISNLNTNLTINPISYDSYIEWFTFIQMFRYVLIL